MSYKTLAKEYSMIPIKDIEMDQVMKKTLLFYGISTKNFNIKTNNKIVGIILPRMESIITAIDKNKVLEPIKVEKHEKVTTIYVPIYLRNSDYTYFQTKKTTLYSVLDGRHRVAASIIKGYKYVPAIINGEESIKTEKVNLSRGVLLFSYFSIILTCMYFLKLAFPSFSSVIKNFFILIFVFSK
jgi:hypothetical protein